MFATTSLTHKRSNHTHFKLCCIGFYDSWPGHGLDARVANKGTLNFLTDLTSTFLCVVVRMRVVQLLQCCKRTRYRQTCRNNINQSQLIRSDKRCTIQTCPNWLWNCITTASKQEQRVGKHMRSTQLATDLPDWVLL
jgi:hypothetical protein